MEGETSKVKKLASVERLNLNMSDPMNANLSSIFKVFNVGRYCALHDKSMCRSAIEDHFL